MTTSDAFDLDAVTENKFDLTSRARISKIIRELYTESARKGGDGNDLWLSAASHISSTSLRFQQSIAGDPVEPFEWDMHDLWYLYIHASMNINDQCAEQDRLVVQILQMRELGVLVRKGENDDTTEEARTSDGRIWKDLPFLIPDMTHFWLLHSGSLTSVHRQNLASFLAKLASVSVGGEKFCGLALIILRNALESSKPLSLAASDDEAISQNTGIVDLLPAANSWLFHAGQQIIRLSDKSIDIFAPEVGMLGELARAEGGVPENCGFSPQRWLFWFKRLEEIASDEHNEDHGHESREFARGMLGNMTSLVCESDSAMKHELARQCKLPVEGFE